MNWNVGGGSSVAGIKAEREKGSGVGRDVEVSDVLENDFFMGAEA